MITQKLLRRGIPFLAGATAATAFTAGANVVAAATAAVVAAAATPQRPNIIVILTDDMGYSDLGCFGSEIETPNLDRLAQGGLKLTQFYTTPRCCPTRASLLTGLYSHQAGIGNMMQDNHIPGYRGELGKDTVTIAEELKGAGYATAAIGKWHVCHINFDGKRQLNFESKKPFWDTKDNWPLQRGFDSYFGTIHGVNSYYDPFSLVDGNNPVDAPQVSKNFYYTDVLTDKAVAQIDAFAAGGGKPFFMYLAYTAAHWPLQAPEPVIAKYRERYLAGSDKIREARHRRQLQMGLIDKNWPLSPRDPRATTWEKTPDHEWEANRMATYAAMVEIMDQGVGRIHDELKAKGMDKNTLIVFLSDNGGCAEGIGAGYYDVPSRLRDGRPVKVGNNDHTIMAGPEDVWQSYGPRWANVSDTPFLRYKHFTHEGGISTACIMHWPDGIKHPGTVTNQVGHIIDLLPTFADIAGATHPATRAGHPVQPLEGRSLLPVIEGGTREAAPLFWEHEGNRAVRAGDWKLVALNNKPWELYNMAADRTERNDLAAATPEKVAELDKLWNAWAKRCHVLPKPREAKQDKKQDRKAAKPGKKAEKKAGKKLIYQ
ncbi:MAG: arylsulfatase [Opitutaceae bacterium]|jgi:arylsulfatase|nr:arylsulfatase [Opitutaceae bacterium]